MNSFKIPGISVSFFFFSLNSTSGSPISAQTCPGMCDGNMGKSHFGRDLCGRSGGGYLGHQDIWSPGRDTQQAQAVAVLQAGRDVGSGRDVESIILMSEKQMVTPRGKGEHCVCFCAHTVAFQAEILKSSETAKVIDLCSFGGKGQRWQLWC